MRCFVALFIVFAGAALGQPANDRFAAEDRKIFAAVGMVAIGPEGNDNICTGALIAPDKVLTAAHCIVNQATGSWASARQVTFFAGQTERGYATSRVAARLLADPAFEPSIWSDVGKTDFEAMLDAVATDLAIVELAQPIPPERVAPLPLANDAGFAGPIALFGYGDQESDALKPYPACLLLYRDSDSVSLSCRAEPGVSGAPILGEHNGGWRIFGVVSLIRYGTLLGSIGPRASQDALSRLEPIRKRETNPFNSVKRSGKTAPID